MAVQKKRKQVRKSKAYMYYNDTYGFCTYLYVGTVDAFKSTCTKLPIKLSKSAAEELYESVVVKDPAGCTLALSSRENGLPSCWLIYLDDSRDAISMLATLSHECSHVSYFALEARDWSNFNTLDTQHTQIYLSDAIFESFLNKMNKDKVLKISK